MSPVLSRAMKKPHAMMPPGAPSAFLKKAWSPAVRDPRFSRGRCDAQIARIRDAKAVRGMPGVGSTWASYMIGERARKLHKHDPLRCDLLLRLENMADAAEAAPVPAGLQVYMGSPALHKAVRAQETVSLLPLQRSVLVGKDVVIAAPVFG